MLRWPKWQPAFASPPPTDRWIPDICDLLPAPPPLPICLQVNVEAEELQPLAQGMQVTSLPWFHLFRGGDLLASFSANLSTVGELRKQVASHKGDPASAATMTATATTAEWARSL